MPVKVRVHRREVKDVRKPEKFQATVCVCVCVQTLFED